MHAVAVDASGHGFITRSQSFAVDAGGILRQLTDPLLRLELFHQGRIAVTTRAKLGYGSTGNVAGEAVGLAHGLFGIVGRAIAPVAIRAVESRLGVYVVLETNRRCLQVAVERRVTFDASVFSC